MITFKKFALVTGMACAAISAQAAEFTLTSPDVAEGQMISQAQVLNGFGCSGGNISPALAWSNAPKGTKSFVITAYDPDAPTGSGWWHWVVLNVPASTTGLAENAGSGTGLPVGTVQSRSDFGTPGYGGACPPAGVMHRYQFTVYALGVEKLDVGPDVSAALVGFMTHANVLGQARITAIYKR